MIIDNKPDPRAITGNSDGTNSGTRAGRCMTKNFFGGEGVVDGEGVAVKDA